MKWVISFLLNSRLNGFALHKAAPTTAAQLSPLGREILQWLEEDA